MGRRHEHAAVLRELPAPAWPAHLRVGSGLVTDAYLAGPRTGEDAEALRKALGYCWSVAVAADPGPGLTRFAGYTGGTDKDLVRIVRENLRKARMRAVAS